MIWPGVLGRGADLQTALERTCSTWLISMPIAACQLVLTTAVEDHVFVTDPNFAVTLPLAASGAVAPPQPFQRGLGNPRTAAAC